MVSITSIETKLVQKEAKHNCTDSGSWILKVNFIPDLPVSRWKTSAGAPLGSGLAWYTGLLFSENSHSRSAHFSRSDQSETGNSQRINRSVWGLHQLPQPQLGLSGCAYLDTQHRKYTQRELDWRLSLWADHPRDCRPSFGMAGSSPRQTAILLEFRLWLAAHFKSFQIVLIDLGIFKFGFNVQWLFKKVD